MPFKEEITHATTERKFCHYTEHIDLIGNNCFINFQKPTSNDFLAAHIWRIVWQQTKALNIFSNTFKRIGADDWKARSKN